MGLEIAELILEVEERYAIEIDEDDVKDIQTFGDLADMVKRKIDEPLRTNRSLITTKTPWAHVTVCDHRSQLVVSSVVPSNVSSEID